MVASVQFVEDLRLSLNRVLEVPLEGLPFYDGTDIPVTFDLPPGVQTVSIDFFRAVGEAALIAPGASDIPLVHVAATRDDIPVVAAVSSYETDFFGERANTFAGKETLVQDRRVKAVLRVIAEKIHKFAAVGEPQLGVRGLLNNAQVTLTNSAFNGNTATFNDFVTFFMDIILTPIFSSNRVAMVDSIRISPNLMRKLITSIHPTDANTTALETINKRLAALSRNVSIIERPECASSYLEANGVQAVGANLDRVLVFYNNEDVLARQMEDAVAQPFPDEYAVVKGTKRFFPMFAVTSATQIYNLDSLTYITHARVN
jgi:hypothetical protein